MKIKVPTQCPNCHIKFEAEADVNPAAMLGSIKSEKKAAASRKNVLLAGEAQKVRKKKKQE